MKKLMFTALFSSIFLCSAFAAPIQFSTEIPLEQRSAIENDLFKFSRWQLAETQYDRELKEVMGLEDLSASSLLDWLNERVGYVVSESFDREEGFTDLDEWFSFPNPFAFPTFDEDTSAPADPNKKMYTVMANIGTAKYLMDKSRRDLHALLFAGSEGEVQVPIKSPRVGLIQVGEGLFLNKLAINKNDINADANSIMRLITLFHEARHSDGNGGTLGFFHAACPVGHEYQGKSVCDKSLNGPYTIDGLLTLKLIASCISCSADEIQLLTERAEDSLSRVITEYSVRDYTDEVKKRISDYEEYITQLKGQWNSPYLTPKREAMISNSITSTQNALDRLLKTGETVEKIVESTFWDATPE